MLWQASRRLLSAISTSHHEFGLTYSIIAIDATTTSSSILLLRIYLILLFPLPLVMSRSLSVTISRTFRFASFYTDLLNPVSLMNPFLPHMAYAARPKTDDGHMVLISYEYGICTAYYSSLSIFLVFVSV